MTRISAKHMAGLALASALEDSNTAKHDYPRNAMKIIFNSGQNIALTLLLPIFSG